MQTLEESVFIELPLFPLTPPRDRGMHTRHAWFETVRVKTKLM